MKKLKVKIKLKPTAVEVPSEHIEQCKVIAFCDSYPMLRNTFAIPNGGKRTMVTAMKMQAEGLRSGVPDLQICLPTDKYHGLFIEMKKLKGSSLSENQKDWINRLNEAGYKAVVCKGHMEAINVICEYAGIVNPYQNHE
jgi:hypothetical protein